MTSLLIAALVLVNLVAWVVTAASNKDAREARDYGRTMLQARAAADLRVAHLEHELSHEKALHRERVRRRSRVSSPSAAHPEKVTNG